MKPDPIKEFETERVARVASHPTNEALTKSAAKFMQETLRVGYSYNFSWLGMPVIQYPQDIVVLQEIIWEVKPDLIIETGIARGGSLILSASLLELLGNNGLVVGIDIDIREHNRQAIQQHPLAKRIQMIQGSSIDQLVIGQVEALTKDKTSVLVLLDSNHTHEHVLAELNAYAHLASVGSYCIVYDTIVEDIPNDADWQARPWGKGNNPKTAVWEFLKENNTFEIDKAIQNKLLITVAPDGYLKRVC